MVIADDRAVPRRRLMVELRAARAAAGLAREEVVEALGWSLSKVVRIETGEQGVSVTDLRAMLELYGVSGEEHVQELTALARSGRRQSYWSGYRDVISKQFGQYLGYEGSASYICTFHPLLIPGLLHTDEYAFEILRMRMPEERARKLVNLRMKRQERLLGQPRPPEMAFIFGEEALIRWIGGPSVMRRQLQYLLEVADKAGVTVQIVPLSVGSHPGLSGSFILLGLQETGEDLLFLEGASGDLVSRDDQEMIDPFIESFGMLRGMALSAEGTKMLVTRQIELLGESGQE
jgi:transcriptional regulator with XRE-family HTH domain